MSITTPGITTAIGAQRVLERIEASALSKIVAAKLAGDRAAELRAQAHAEVAAGLLCELARTAHGKLGPLGRAYAAKARADALVTQLGGDPARKEA
jgi:hypothetical protein